MRIIRSTDEKYTCNSFHTKPKLFILILTDFLNSDILLKKMLNLYCRDTITCDVIIYLIIAIKVQYYIREYYKILVIVYIISCREK